MLWDAAFAGEPARRCTIYKDVGSYCSVAVHKMSKGGARSKREQPTLNICIGDRWFIPAHLWPDETPTNTRYGIGWLATILAVPKRRNAVRFQCDNENEPAELVLPVFKESCTELRLIDAQNDAICKCGGKESLLELLVTCGDDDVSRSIMRMLPLSTVFELEQAAHRVKAWARRILPRGEWYSTSWGFSRQIPNYYDYSGNVPSIVCNGLRGEQHCRIAAVLPPVRMLHEHSDVVVSSPGCAPDKYAWCSLSPASTITNSATSGLLAHRRATVTALAMQDDLIVASVTINIPNAPTNNSWTTSTLVVWRTALDKNPRVLARACVPAIPAVQEGEGEEDGDNAVHHYPPSVLSLAFVQRTESEAGNGTAYLLAAAEDPGYTSFAEAKIHAFKLSDHGERADYVGEVLEALSLAEQSDPQGQITVITSGAHGVIGDATWGPVYAFHVGRHENGALRCTLSGWDEAQRHRLRHPDDDMSTEDETELVVNCSCLEDTASVGFGTAHLTMTPMLVAGCGGTTVRVWSVRTRQLLHDFSPCSQVAALALSGSVLLTGGDRKGRLRCGTLRSPRSSGSSQPVSCTQTVASAASYLSAATASLLHASAMAPYGSACW